MLVLSKRLVGVLGNISYLISTIIIVLIAGSVMWEVISRYVLGDSSIWVTEVSGYLLAGALFLGLGKTYRNDGHVRMSVVLEKMQPEKARKFLVASDVIVAIFAILLLWQTAQLTLDSYQFNWKSSTLLEVPLYLPQLLMTLGSLVFFLEVVLTAITRLHNTNNTPGAA